jgi:hypothetical protein
MEPGAFCSTRAMSLMDSPALHRFHNSFLCPPQTALQDGPLSTLMHLRSAQHPKSTVLHRPVESTAAFFAREDKIR